MITKRIPFLLAVAAALAATALPARTQIPDPDLAGALARGEVPDPPDPELVKLAGERLRDLSTRLDLTEDQKTKIRPILLEQAPKLRALRDDPSLPKSERRARMRELFYDTDARIVPLLTREQVRKLEGMREEAIRKQLAARNQQPPG